MHNYLCLTGGAISPFWLIFLREQHVKKMKGKWALMFFHPPIFFFLLDGFRILNDDKVLSWGDSLFVSVLASLRMGVRLVRIVVSLCSMIWAKLDNLPGCYSAWRNWRSSYAVWYTPGDRQHQLLFCVCNDKERTWKNTCTGNCVC